MCTFWTLGSHVCEANLSWKVLENEFCESWKTLEFGLCKSWKVLENSFLLSVRTLNLSRIQHQHTHTPVDGTSMNEECEAVNAVQPQVDRQVCAVRFLT